MAYPNQKANPSDDLLFLTDEKIREQVELLFFAYKGFTGDPDRILGNYDLGRAHHRAIHFINRHPGLTVSTLLEILGITKQSLNRVLRTLMEMGFVESIVGERDRRERHLSLTEEGRKFEAELARAQHKRMREAFAEAGPEAVAGFRRVLGFMVEPAAQKFLRPISVSKTDDEAS